MIKPTDFSRLLSNFLSKYLPGERGMSTHTISSYRYTFILFVSFMDQQQHIKPSKLELSHISRETVIEFLDWLQSERKITDASRNVRLAALHSFFHYLQYQHPEKMTEWQRILSIKAKKHHQTSATYLSVEGIKLLLEQPDINTCKGRRDLTLLALMYDCAARVQEIIDAVPSSIRLDKPYTIKIIGKGNKARIVPLMEESVAYIKRYMSENNLLAHHLRDSPLFCNSRKQKLTRAGMNSILGKYAEKAKRNSPGVIPDRISCHTLRHSKAMHLLQAGVNLVYIRDYLGHTSVQTTEIYARVNSKQKLEAIEKAYVNVVGKEVPEWVDNKDLLEWLKSFN